MSPVKQTQRAVTLCEICLSLAVFSTAIGCWIKFSQIQKQQQIGIRTQLDIPIYVDAFEHMLDTTSADKLGQWFAWKDPSTKHITFSRTQPTCASSAFTIYVTAAQQFSKSALEITLRSANSKNTFQYIKEIFRTTTH